MNRNDGAISLKLDGITAQLLVHLAEVWGITEEEAIRRALERVTSMIGPPNKDELAPTLEEDRLTHHRASFSSRLEAFKELQRNLHLTSAQAREWQDAVHEARR